MFLLNRIPSKAVEKTPYELWTGKHPSLSFLKIWGCEAYVKCQASNKLASKSVKCLFVGYPKETKGYYIYIPSENKVFVAHNGFFLEREFISKESVGVRHLLKKFKNQKLPPSLPWIFYKTHNQLLSRHLLHKAHEGPVGFIMSPRDMDFS